MSSLKSNLVISTIALILVGSIRPAFNAVVNRVFGPEANGHAANLIALIFLASLPATAGLPTVAVRYVSRAHGGGREQEAVAYARLSTILAVLLTLLGIAGAIAHGFLALDPPLGRFDGVIVAVGIAGYAYWRLYRSLLLSVGKAMGSLKAEIASVVALWIALVVAVALDEAKIAIFGFVLVYVVYAVLTIAPVLPLLGKGEIEREDKRSFVRYTVLWFIASGASLAVKEMSVLLLDARADKATVGEFSVALSLLMVLALASRVLELPLLHELSALAGKKDIAGQRELTARAIDWMTVIMIAIGFGVALIAGPALEIIGHVTTPDIILAFVIITLAFTSEMVMTPANNLLVSEAPPSVMTGIGALSFALAIMFWYSPWGGGFFGVVLGLALSHLVRSALIAWYVKARYAVALYSHPFGKTIVLAAGSGLLWAEWTKLLNPWLALALFETIAIAAFGGQLRSMLAVVLPGGLPSRLRSR